MECVRIIRIFHTLIKSNSFHSIVCTSIYSLYESRFPIYCKKTFANRFY
nr:MAG TPA: hypothetical protein [Caudoviricetes sp.]